MHEYSLSDFVELSPHDDRMEDLSNPKTDDATNQRCDAVKNEHVSTELDPSMDATRKCRNEESCLIYKLSNDLLAYCFGFLGAEQFRFLAGTSKRFYNAYLEAFRGEKVTGLDSITESECRGRVT